MHDLFSQRMKGQGLNATLLLSLSFAICYDTPIEHLFYRVPHNEGASGSDILGLSVIGIKTLLRIAFE